MKKVELRTVRLSNRLLLSSFYSLKNSTTIKLSVDINTSVSRRCYINYNSKRTNRATWMHVEILLSIVSPKTNRLLYGWYVARNLRADANGSMRLPIMLICDCSRRCVLRQTTGLSNRLNVCDLNSHWSSAVSPDFTINIWPRVSICSCKPVPEARI